MRSGTVMAAVVCVGALGIGGFFGGRMLALEPCDCEDCPAESLIQDREVEDPPANMPAANQVVTILDRKKDCDVGKMREARKELAHLEAKVSLLEKLLEGQQQATFGTPIQWKEAPSQFQATEFKSLMREAVKEIGDKSELVRIDCQQLPCLVVTRAREVEEFVSVRSTTVWKENFRDQGSSYVALLDCDDGRREKIEILSAFWDGKNDPKIMSAEEYKKIAKQYYREEVSEYKRQFDDSLSSRWKKIRKNWKCRPVE